MSSKRSREDIEEDFIEEFEQMLKKVKMDSNKRKSDSDDDNPSAKKQKLDDAVEYLLMDYTPTPAVIRDITRSEVCQLLGLEKDVDDDLIYPSDIADKEILQSVTDEVPLNLNGDLIASDVVPTAVIPSDDNLSKSSGESTIDSGDQSAQGDAMDDTTTPEAESRDIPQCGLDSLPAPVAVENVPRLIMDDIMTMDETQFNQLLMKEGVTFDRKQEIQTRKVRDDEQKKFTTVDAEEEKWYDVDKIKKRRLLQSKQRKKKPTNADYEYFVSWLGYSSKFDSWEPYENLAHLKMYINVQWR